MTQPIRIKDHEKDARLVRSRVVFGAIMVVTLIGVLIARLYFLQVIQYDYHSTLSENTPGACAADSADPWPDFRPQRRGGRG
jgi:cell division protein FtsI/penicillin-binding protein 2